MRVAKGTTEHSPADVAITLPQYNLPAIKELTLEEKLRFREVEKEIEEKLQVIEERGDEVSALLWEVHDKKYFREQYPKWEEYCQGRWSRTGRWGRQLVNFAEVRKSIQDDPDRNHGSALPVPTSERQTRPLTGLPPEEQREIWNAAVENSDGKVPSGKQVEEAKAKIKPPKLDEFDPDELNRWIDIVCKRSKPGEEMTVGRIFHRKGSGFSYRQVCAINDAMIDRVLIKDRRYAPEEESKWPQPDENGVYAEPRAGSLNVFEFRHAKASAQVRVLQIGEDCWISSREYIYRSIGNCAADLRPLMTNRTFKSRIEALRDALIELRKSQQGILSGTYAMVTATQKRIAKMMVVWCGTILREHCVEPDGQVEPGKEETLPEDLDPPVEKLAKKVYQIAMASVNDGDRVTSWERIEGYKQKGFVAIARWHLGEILSLARVSKAAEDDAHESKAELSRVRAAAAGFPDLPTKKIKQEKTEKTNEEKFVICRNIKGQKPKYWAGPNAWTIDPAKAKHLARKAAGARLTHTKKFASCKKDFMIALAKVERMQAG